MTSIPDEVRAKIVEGSGHLECPVCHRLLRDHTREESIEHLRQDVKIELDIAPLTVESAIKFGVGRKMLLNAIRYLDRMYGEEELDAVELMRESYKMGGD